MCLSISTHPDISNAVRAVARYCTAPRGIHWKAALGILEYIIDGTSEYGVTFQRWTLSSISLDADYASKATDRRSVSGGAIMCGGAVYVGLPGLRNASHFRLQKQSTLLSGTL